MEGKHSLNPSSIILIKLNEIVGIYVELDFGSGSCHLFEALYSMERFSEFADICVTLSAGHSVALNSVREPSVLVKKAAATVRQTSAVRVYRGGAPEVVVVQ